MARMTRMEESGQTEGLATKDTREHKKLEGAYMPVAWEEFRGTFFVGFCAACG
jgi:hypothetical protein